MRDTVMPVVLAADSGFVVPTYISLYSMLKNVSADRAIDIYILSPGDYSKETVDWLKGLEGIFKNASITIIDMGDAYKGIDIKYAVEAIKYIPLKKNLKEYKGRRGYIQDLSIVYIKNVEEVI